MAASLRHIVLVGHRKGVGMFGHGNDSVFEKISELRARIMSLGAPSEQALYMRKSVQRSQVISHTMPASARRQVRSAARLEHDSASMIRKGYYSGTRS